MLSPTRTENWWDTALAGVVAILFGLVALFWPGPTLTVLIVLFGVFAVVYGIVQLIGAFRARSMHTSWWPSLAIGVLSLLAGIVTFFWPGMTTFILLYIIAFWALVVGVIEIVVGVAGSKWLVALLGLITLSFGFILMVNPFSGALGVVMLIGVFAIVRGVIQVIEAFQAPAATGTA